MGNADGGGHPGDAPQPTPTVPTFGNPGDAPQAAPTYPNGVGPMPQDQGAGGYGKGDQPDPWFNARGSAHGLSHGNTERGAEQTCLGCLLAEDFLLSMAPRDLGKVKRYP